MVVKLQSCFCCLQSPEALPGSAGHEQPHGFVVAETAPASDRPFEFPLPQADELDGGSNRPFELPLPPEDELADFYRWLTKIIFEM